jgi:hypothetical protein
VTRIAFALLFATVAGVAVAEDKPLSLPIIEVKLDKADKIKVKPGKWAVPSVALSEDDLKDLVPDEATRGRIAKQVDLKTHNLLVFTWEGSGGDKLEYKILESFPEQVPFSLKPGVTDDARTHVKLFAVRKNVRWSAK